MAAKYYIYRNLNRGGFSVKYKGLVIANMHRFTADDVRFQVSDASRNRAVREGRRNVHAYMVCDKEPIGLHWKDETFEKHVDENNMKPVYYHPLQTETFVIAGTSTPVTEAKHIVAANEKVFITPK